MGAPVGCETTYFPATMSDRTHLEALLIALDASPIALERPNCRGWVGEYQITGKHGHVLADHPGYLLYVTGTVQRWKKAKRILPGTVTQDGDDEGVLRLDRLPTPAEADTIRDVVGIRRRRHMTAEALANLERARKAIKSPVPEPGSAQATGPAGSGRGRASAFKWHGLYLALSCAPRAPAPPRIERASGHLRGQGRAV
jgi:hypothetical protein